MGIYLNSLSAHTLYRNEMRKPYFVDKTAMLEELFPLIREGSNYICVTRPRRFGKTVIANMISSFFGKGADSHEIFDRLSIADAKEYREYLNRRRRQSGRSKTGGMRFVFRDCRQAVTLYRQNSGCRDYL